MGAITDLWKSERGLLAVALIIAATVLTALGTMTVDQWKTFVMAIFGMYAGSKAISSAAESLGLGAAARYRMRIEDQRAGTRKAVEIAAAKLDAAADKLEGK